MTTTEQTGTVHPNTEILRTIYRDLRRLREFAADDIVLHPCDQSAPRTGACAAMTHEQALLDLVEGTLVMDVEHIQANDHFGTVLGTLRATRPRTVAMPFCGLWRFEAGRIVEHWENAYDPGGLARLLSPMGP